MRLRPALIGASPDQSSSLEIIYRTVHIWFVPIGTIIRTDFLEIQTMQTLDNSVILVTGANRGIGKAMVESFLAAGAAKVYAAARRQATLDPLVEANPGRVVPLRIDVTDDGSGMPLHANPGVGLSSMRERAEELGGTLEIRSTGSKGTQITALLPL
jgi:hypothetical protein